MAKNIHFIPGFSRNIVHFPGKSSNDIRFSKDANQHDIDHYKSREIAFDNFPPGRTGHHM